MFQRIGLSALQIPLRGGWYLEIRRKGFRENCRTLAGLPDKWFGCVEARGPIYFERTGKGSRISLTETVSMIWEVFQLEGGSVPMPQIFQSKSFVRTSRIGSAPSGDFNSVNHLGFLELSIRCGRNIQKIGFEIISAKFDQKQDFEVMTADIAAKCQQLLLEWNAPTGVPIITDTARRKRLLLEQFLFLSNSLGENRLECWMELIRANPHKELMRNGSWRSIDRASSTDFLSQPSRYTRRWIRMEGREIPSEVFDFRKVESKDTPPNRFVQHALEGFYSLCREVMRLFPLVSGPAHSEASVLSARISAILGGTFFQDISSLKRLPLDSQTLQKKEGYRDILRVWLLAEQAVRLDWNGRSDVFSGTVRNVATLYEYWLFFELWEALRAIPHITEIENSRKVGGSDPVFCRRQGRVKINLKRGRSSVMLFEQRPPKGDPMRIHFWFDRSYMPTKTGDVLRAGTYSRSFRPDYSLVIFPARYAEKGTAADAERKAEEEGKLFHLHFDAKYRVEDIREIFGNEEAKKNISEKKNRTYKRADLFKMHAYNDAIRRTAGSYILFPGKAQPRTSFRKYHDLLPSVGAFAMSPSVKKEVRRGEIVEFINAVLTTYRNRYSQFAMLNFGHRIPKEEILNSLAVENGFHI